jgi:hypothetical protein
MLLAPHVDQPDLREQFPELRRLIDACYAAVPLDAAVQRDWTLFVHQPGKLWNRLNADASSRPWTGPATPSSVMRAPESW